MILQTCANLANLLIMVPKPVVVFLLLLLVVLGLALTCTATTYTVGDSSGWDISTDLDSWTRDKVFNVNDVLLFQYSSSHSVAEVTRENYQGCNTTNVVESNSNGNTTFVLTQPGDRYFICGDKLHCYGGMKLHVLTQKSQGTPPATAPQPESGGGSSSLPRPSSKSNNPSTVTPNLAMLYGVGLCLVSCTLFVDSVL